MATANRTVRSARARVGTDAEANVRTLDKVAEDINKDIVESSKRLEWVRWVQRNVAPRLSSEAQLSSSMYDYYSGAINVDVPEVEGREWRGLNGTAGAIYRVRKALNIKKLTRTTYTYGGAEGKTNTYFHGTGVIADKDICVHIRLGGQLPPTCHIEFTEEVVTEVKKVAKVVCG